MRFFKGTIVNGSVQWSQMADYDHELIGSIPEYGIWSYYAAGEYVPAGGTKFDAEKVEVWDLNNTIKLREFVPTWNP